MTRYKHKMTASVPATRRDAVNAELNRVLGCGPDTFHVPIETARGVVTRYGTQWRMTPEAKAVLVEVLGRIENTGSEHKEGERIEDHAIRLGLKRKRNTKQQIGRGR